MSYRQRQLGVIPSPQDYRDYKLNRVTAVKRAFPEDILSPIWCRRLMIREMWPPV